MHHDDVDKTADSLARIAAEGPQLNADFTRAHAGEERAPTAPQVESEQVRNDAPELNLPPPPGVGAAVARATHWQRAARDDDRARAENRQAEKDAFVRRAVDQLGAKPIDRGSDRGRE